MTQISTWALGNPWSYFRSSWYLRSDSELFKFIELCLGHSTRFTNRCFFSFFYLVQKWDDYVIMIFMGDNKLIEKKSRLRCRYFKINFKKEINKSNRKVPWMISIIYISHYCRPEIIWHVRAVLLPLAINQGRSFWCQKIKLYVGFI